MSVGAYRTLIALRAMRQLVTHTFSIGADSRCDYVLDDALVSSWHARVTETSTGRYQIEDMQSTNGTFVNNRRVRTIEVGPHDTVRLGSAQFNVRLLVTRAKEAIGHRQPSASAARAATPGAGARYIRCACGAVALAGTHCECGREV